MSEKSTHQDGDEIRIGDDTIALHARKGSNGIRWGWYCEAVGVGGEGYKATPELAIADATATLAGPECRHGTPAGQFCPTCHDTEI